MRRRAAAGAVAIGLLGTTGAAGCSADRTGATAWDLRSPVDGTTVELLVHVGSTGCNEFAGIDLDEGDDEVRITARARRVNSGSGECASDLLTAELTLELRRPLGDRDLTGCRPRDPIQRAQLPPGPNCGA